MENDFYANQKRIQKMLRGTMKTIKKHIHIKCMDKEQRVKYRGNRRKSIDIIDKQAEIAFGKL